MAVMITDHSPSTPAIHGSAQPANLSLPKPMSLGRLATGQGQAINPETVSWLEDEEERLMARLVRVRALLKRARMPDTAGDTEERATIDREVSGLQMNVADLGNVQCAHLFCTCRVGIYTCVAHIGKISTSCHVFLQKPITSFFCPWEPCFSLRSSPLALYCINELCRRV